MSRDGLADEMMRVGRAAGLDAVGVCPADPFDFEREVIESRRAAGLSADMQFTYRNPARSTDPAATLEGARSLVVGARRYLRAEPGSTRPDRDVEGHPPLEARVARYSWVDHYAPLRRGLEEVAAALVGEGFQARVLVDDNALVDRAAAVRAGLGWYGNNANVLLPGAGSWFVLGSVVTDADLIEHERPTDRPHPLRPDPPGPDPSRPGRANPTPGARQPGWGCGSCRRCLDACPTRALIGPGVLDARRCLAWLLQAPGVFPREHRAALGDRLYGCDDCQEVCPINAVGARRDPPAPADAGAQIRLRVLELLAGSDDELLRLVGRWYIPGREARYVRRNLLVILGNSGRGGDPAVVGALRAALADPDGLVRAHAVWAAGNLGRTDLLDVVAGDADPLVLEEMASGGGGR